MLVSLAAPLLAQSAVNFTLTAAEGTADLGPGYPSETAWTYNGSLPGPTIRVTEGQLLRVRFQNHLSQDTILHFHGQPLPGGMDGMSAISRP
ncbi:MAG TPA: multicopper oxidase domain-containing protein, partial [Planctomycetota bacterium]|nr:multicopper oxidase domain-containing protein [Planctomycetota bacterium]